MTVMPYRPLGRTGIRVSVLSLGTAMLGRVGTADHDEAVRVVHGALDAGINTIDTADSYSEGEAERIVGKALSNGRRDDVILATKVTKPMGEDINRRGASRRWIVRAVEESLQRLDTEWIDIVQLHRYDPMTDLDDGLGALTDLVRAGKVRYAGTSTFPAHAIVESQWVAQQRMRERFVTDQPPYSLLSRAAEADVFPVAQRFGLGVLTWSPLGSGWLAGRGIRAIAENVRGARVPHLYDLSLPANRLKVEAVEKFSALADEAGISLIDLAVAFALRHRAVSSIIVGPRIPEQLERLISASMTVLDDGVLRRIDEIVPPGVTLNRTDAGWENPALAADQRWRPQNAPE